VQKKKYEDNYKWTATDMMIDIVKYQEKNSLYLYALFFSFKVRLRGSRISKLPLGVIYWLKKFLLKNFKANDKNFHLQAKFMSKINNFDDKGYNSLYYSLENIFNAALNCLRKLNLNLTFAQNYRLSSIQTVIKAQRVYLQPEEEYMESWHQEGKHETIVAVVLYFYLNTANMEGGDIEFVEFTKGKREFSDMDDSLNSDLYRPVDNYFKNIKHCKVHIKPNTLVIFTNQDVIHRVLKMQNNSKETAYRDFVAFFIVDQNDRLDLTNPDEKCKKATMEYNRNIMFQSQMEQIGVFGINGTYSKHYFKIRNLKDRDYNNRMSEKNGTLYLSQLEYGYIDPDKGLELPKELSNCENLVENLNKDPPLNRGISWCLNEYFDS
jgi:hypothetical protein